MFEAQAKVSPAVANLTLASGQMPQDLAKDVEMLPRTLAVADQIGKQQLFPTAQLQATLSIYVARMLIPHVPRWITPEERKRQEFVKHLVTKPEAVSDIPSDKPKDQ